MVLTKYVPVIIPNAMNIPIPTPIKPAFLKSLVVMTIHNSTL